MLAFFYLSNLIILVKNCKCDLVFATRTYILFAQDLTWRLWNIRTSASLSGMLVVKTRYADLILF